MSKEAIRVAAVVVTWNGARWIRPALDSLRTSICPVRIVVVDNASTDETRAIVTKHYPEVTLLNMPANVGFGVANNVGISWALRWGAEYVLLLNQDARVHPETISQLCCSMEKQTEYGVLSPVQLNGGGTEFDHGFSMYVQPTQWLSDLYLNRTSGVYPVEFVNAAVWLLSRRCLMTVGGFDPFFFMYGEDNDYCNRAMYHGFKIGIIPESIAYHAREDRRDIKARSRCIRNEKRREDPVLKAALKDLRISLKRGYVTIAIETCRNVQMCLLNHEWKKAIALGMSCVGATAWVWRLWKSRRLCRRPGHHWLDLN